MKKSSAHEIPYDIRPSKQTERRILLDILKLAGEVGTGFSQYQYVGFGGFKFYDFEMLFRHVGVRDMISIERDRSIFARCKFNRPFKFIEMKNCPLSEYVEQCVFRKPIVAWLDYDSRLSRDIVDDVSTIGAKAPVGSFVFVTIDARMPNGMRGLPTEQRLAGLREDYQAFALNPTDRDVEPAQFPIYAERVLWAAVTDSLSARREGRFVPLIRVFYGDTAPMITVGACLANTEIAPALVGLMRREFRYLLPARRHSPYTIPPFNLTMRERHLLDAAVTSNTEGKRLRRVLKKIGMTRELVSDYRRMVRFVPKYFETYI
jgi:hypothetical protein